MLGRLENWMLLKLASNWRQVLSTQPSGPRGRYYKCCPARWRSAVDGDIINIRAWQPRTTISTTQPSLVVQRVCKHGWKFNLPAIPEVKQAGPKQRRRLRAAVAGRNHCSSAWSTPGKPIYASPGVYMAKNCRQVSGGMATLSRNEKFVLCLHRARCLLLRWVKIYVY